MKRAILYTLKQTEVDYLPQLNVYRYSPMDYNLLRIGGSGEFLSTPPDLEVVKLNPYHVCKIEKPRTPVLNPDPCCEDRRVKDTFFYLEPALEEIIKAPFKSECEALKNDVVKLVRDRNNATGFRVSKYDASVVADNDDLDIHYYTTKVYDITR